MQVDDYRSIGQVQESLIDAVCEQTVRGAVLFVVPSKPKNVSIKCRNCVSGIFFPFQNSKKVYRKN